MRRFCLKLLCIACLGATVSGNAASLLTFDDISAGGALGPNPPVPGTYGGLNWANFGVINGLATESSYGYHAGVVSPANVAFNFFGAPASISIADGLFDLNSAYLTLALNLNTLLNIQVQGSARESMLYDNTYVVNSSAPTLVNFNYFGVDKVTFISSPAQQFAMDNLWVSVPEPGTINLLLFSTAWFGIGCFRKRYRNESDLVRERAGRARDRVTGPCRASLARGR